VTRGRPSFSLLGLRMWSIGPPNLTNLTLHGSFTPVSKHLPDAPGRWEEFFAQAFAPDPADRPTSVRMFVSQLGRAFS